MIFGRKGVSTRVVLFFIIIFTAGIGFLLPQMVLNNIEIIVEDVTYVREAMDYAWFDYKLHFTIVNNGFLAVTLKEPKISSLWITFKGTQYDLDEELISAIIKIDANGYVEEEVILHFDNDLIPETDYLELTSDEAISILDTEIVRHVLKARASCLYLSRDISTYYDMENGPFYEMYLVARGVSVWVGG